MIHAELIMNNVLNAAFHGFAEQLTEVNPATVVQNGRRPRGDLAYPLAYFKAFIDPQGDTSDVQALLGMLHFGMFCAGGEVDMAEVTGYGHGLRCLQGPSSRRGVIGIIITGDGDQWATAIRNAGVAPTPVQEWGMSCYQQFAKHNLADLMGTVRPKPGRDHGYYLD